MDNESIYPLDFRPTSYWAPNNPVSAILRNIKGDLRRKMISDVLADDESGERKRALLGDLDSGLFDETSHGALEKMDPRWMGGEYLPAYLPGEVEIARVTLESTTRDVYSVRARHTGSIEYRMVDEYATVWELPDRTSLLPLTLGELISLIDKARPEGEKWQDLTDELRDGALEGSGEIEAAARFVSASSDFYPQLAGYYTNKAAQWAARQRERFGNADESE